MIPRFKPYFNFQEIKTALSSNSQAVAQFEKEFARSFQTNYALAFRYGRSAICVFFKALNIKNSQVIMSAYTCSVVADAIIASGNTPYFVDVTPDTYNLDLEKVKNAINSKTKAIISDNTFGYPVDIQKLQTIIRDSGQKIYAIQDCAHGFGARSHSQLICQQGDAAIFSFGISKQISAVFGGMLTTNDQDIYQKVKKFRDENFQPNDFLGQLRDIIYFILSYIAFNNLFYRLTYQFDYAGQGIKFLRNQTNYFKKGRANLPQDANILLSNFNAKIGLSQLKKYPQILARKKIIAKYYDQNLKNIKGLVLPPPNENASYSHYVIKVKNREKIIQAMRHAGIQIGRAIEYCIPYLPAYRQYQNNQRFENSLFYSRHAINLPIYPQLADSQLDRIIHQLKKILTRINHA